MCGFSGYLNLNPDDTILDDHALRTSAKTIAHRGPDDEGVWYEENIGLAHRRLSILDISKAGHQPFSSIDGRYVMVFNGEIYNYKEFVPELEQKGFQFRTGTDTEVLLYMWMAYGDQMFHRLNGMWAFAIWDRKEKNLILCRDRIGVKPLYYAITDKTLYFGSEPKALFALGMQRNLDAEALREHFVFRYVDGDRTLFKDVKKLLPGYYARVIHGKVILKRWWNLAERANNFEKIHDPFSWFDGLFQESVKYRMVSDVPVGILLSAGLDSSSVAQGLHENGFNDIHTYTIRFNEEEHNESHLAQRLSSSLGYQNHSLLVDGQKLLDYTLKATLAADQPLVHQNDGHLVAIADYAKADVKVLLSGEGADELMGGYVRYKTFRNIGLLQNFSNLIQAMPMSSSRFRKLQRFLFSGDTDTLMMWSGNNFFPADLKKLGFAFEEKTAWRQQVLSEAMQLKNHDAIKRLLYLEQHTYLQTLLDRNDTTTMMSGIECREPFLDYRIVEGLMSLPSKWFVKGNKGKHILMNSTAKRLPNYIRDFRKIGLSVPWTQTLRNDPLFKEIMDDNQVFESIFGISMQNISKDFFKGNDENALLIRYLFFFNLWLQSDKLAYNK